MILTLWANKYFRDAVYIAVALLILAGIREHFIHQGKEQGKSEAASSFSQEVEKSRASDREATNKVLDGYKDRIAELDSQYQTAIQSSLKAAAVVASVRQERQESARVVDSMPDSVLEAAVQAKLGHSDPKSPLSYSEQREILSCLNDRPKCEQENEALRNQIQGFNPQIKALSDKVDALNGRYSTLDGYTSRLEVDYQTVQNLIPHKYRSAKCLWLCQKDRKLILPTREKRP